MNSEENSHEIMEGDLILTASDGLFDNMFNWDIEQIINTIYFHEGLDLEKISGILLQDSKMKSKNPSYLSPFAINAKNIG